MKPEIPSSGIKAKFINGVLVISIPMRIDVEQISNREMTRREKTILEAVSRGLQNKEIASELNISERTVKYHVSSLLKNFGVQSRSELLKGKNK